jgi:predicted small lipoprotein YifL
VSGRAALIVVALGLLAASATGCGLKGALEMPEPSTNIVIRGPQQPAAGTGTSAPAESPPAPAPTPVPEAPTDPAQRSTTKAPADDRLPPPPLPGGNTGSARGG